MENLGIILLSILAIMLYFVPTYIASARQHPHRIGIFFVNLVFGWTGWAWVACIVWAYIVTNKTFK